MAAESSTSSIPESFYQDFDDILDVCDDDFFANDEEIAACLNQVASNVETEVLVAGFKCSECEKVCKSKQGLSRHTNAIHIKNKETATSKSTATEIDPESRLHPGIYKKYVRLTAEKLSKDGCYSDATRKFFQDFSWTHEEAVVSYGEIRDIIKKFKGNGEKFYPEFFEIVTSKQLFPTLNKKCARLLGCEVANTILNHLTAGTPNLVSDDTPSTVEFTLKEKNIIAHLSGYVFHTIHSRLSRPTTQTATKDSYIALLIAGKSENKSRPESRLTVAKDRGGLWIMETYVVQIFEEAERYFRKNVVDQLVKKIDGKEIVNSLLENCFILACFSTLRNKCTHKISKELSLNLLEDLLTLFIRARTFSYVKQKRDQFKLENKIKKMKSLRTSIKKASASLEMGH